MSRTVLVADDVAAALGDQQVARLQGPDWAKPLYCWDCEQVIGPDETASVLILRVPELDQQLDGLTPAAVVHTHPTCRSSQVLWVTRAEIQTQQGDTNDVTVSATVLATGQASGYPVLLLSYDSEVIDDDMVNQPHPERVDLVTTMMLEWGWHPIRALDEPPGPGPQGWRVRFSHVEAHAQAPGVVEVVDPAGLVVTAATIEPGSLWRPAVARTGRTALIQGSRILTDGEASLRRAVLAGLVTGGTVPVELAGPGNTVPEASR